MDTFIKIRTLAYYSVKPHSEIMLPENEALDLIKRGFAERVDEFSEPSTIGFDTATKAKG